MVGIEDVARRAGVSVATVSRALRGLPNVADATRARVEAAAAELHYVAHPHASRLAARRSATVGIVVPKLTSWYHTCVLAAAESVFAAAGLDFLPYVVAGREQRERFAGGLPFRKRVDGLVIVDLPFSAKQLRLVGSRVPTISLGVPSDELASVTVENHSGARMAVRHLVTLGHVRIGLIAGRREEPASAVVAPERERGYRSALEEAGIEVDDALRVAGGFSHRGGAEALARLMSLDDPPTAVFALSDEMAIGAMHTARGLGMRVPDDLSIVGFDDNAVATYLGLTTVDQSVAAQGEVAARLLLDALDDTTPAPASRCLPCRLVLRSTTAPPRDGLVPRRPRAGAHPGLVDA